MSDSCDESGMQAAYKRLNEMGVVAAPGIPLAFYCPLSGVLMRDAVTPEDGFSYERSALVKWFADGNATSPVTHEPMATEFFPNVTMQRLINLVADFVSLMESLRRPPNQDS